MTEIKEKHSPSIKKNYFYNVTYQLATLIVSLVTTPYISRVFDTSTIGINSYASSILAFFFLAESFGFSLYAQRAIAQNQGKKIEQSKLLWEILSLRLILCLIVLGVYYCLICFNVFNLSSELMIAYSIQLVATIFDISFFFQGNENFKVIAWVGLLIKAVGTACVFLFVKNNDGLITYVVIQSTTIFVSFLAMWPFLLKKVSFVRVSDLNVTRHFWPCFKLFIPALALNVASLVDKTLIANLVKGTTDRIIDGVETVVTIASLENGYYEQAAKIETACLTIITSFGNVMVPHNSHYVAIGDFDGLRLNIKRSFHFVWLVGLPILFGVIAIANNFVPLFFGSGYEKTIGLMDFMSVLVVITGLSNVFGSQYLIPMKKDRQYTISVVIGLFFNVLFSLILIPFYSSYGAVIGTIIGELSILVSMLIFSKKEISFRDIFSGFAKPFVSGLIMFAAVFSMSLTILSKASVFDVSLLILTGISIYSLLILLLKDDLVILEISKLSKKKTKK